MNNFTKIGVAAVIRNNEKKILLGLKGRAISDEFKNKWVTPGGRVNFQERLHDAIIREVKEETDLTVKVIRSLSPQELIHGDEHFVFFCYEVYPLDNTAKAGDDIIEVKWCDKTELNSLSDQMTPLTRKMIQNINMLEQIEVVRDQWAHSAQHHVELERDFYLKLLKQNNIQFDIRAIPSDTGEHYYNLLERAQNTLREQSKFLQQLSDDFDLMQVGNFSHKKANLQSSIRGLKMLCDVGAASYF